MEEYLMYPATFRFTIAIVLAICGSAISFDSLSAQAPVVNQPPAVVGTVHDAEGRPLPSVQVVVGKLNRGTVTDAQGRFFLRLPRGEYHLDAILIGYAPAHAQVVVPASGPDVQTRLTMKLSAVDLPSLEVTASPTAREPLAVPQATTQVSGKVLERNLAGTLAATIQSQPGLAVRYAGPAASAPVIRGLSGERVLVLENGQRAGDLSGQSADHSVSIDPLAATRIEVIRGPASLLYGSSALGGVVNVISNTIASSVPSQATGYFVAQGETVTPGGAMTGAITLPVGSRWALSARGGGRRTDDQRVGGGDILDNTYFRNYYGTGSLGYIGTQSDGGVAYEGYAFNYGLPAAADDAEAGIHIEGHRHQAQARADRHFSQGAITALNLEGTAQWYVHDEIESSGEIGTTFNLRTQTAQLVANTATNRLSGALGISGLFKQYEATGEEALTPPANSLTGGAFFFQELALGADAEHAAKLQFGGRYDWYRIDSKEGEEKFGPARGRDFTAFSGSVGLSVPIGNSVSLGLSLARAFRAPTVEELFANGFHAALGSFDVGNPDLDAETNTGLDGVLRAQSGRINAQLAGYYNRVNDYITPTIVGDTVTDEGEAVPLTIYTQADASIAGLEGQIEGEVMRNVVLGIMGDWLRGKFRDGGGDLPFMPAARLGSSIRWDNGRFSLSTEYRHAFEQDHVAENEVVAEAYDLLNLSARTNMIAGGRTHSITIRADNVLDEKYRDATSRIKDFALNPGVNYSLVYRVQF
jgi:iron complex outermembrane receptor protein